MTAGFSFVPSPLHLGTSGTRPKRRAIVRRRPCFGKTGPRRASYSFRGRSGRSSPTRTRRASRTPQPFCLPPGRRPVDCRIGQGCRSRSTRDSTVRPRTNPTGQARGGAGRVAILQAVEEIIHTHASDRFEGGQFQGRVAGRCDGSHRCGSQDGRVRLRPPWGDREFR